jgi:hypothetical protein
MDMRGSGRKEDSVSGHAEGCVEAAASEVICISFTPSREYADAIRQDRNIRDGKACGATAGDTWHLGLRTYDVVDPFARHRDDKREPITNPLWRARIEKAKADSERFDRMWAIRDAAEAITDDEFDVWFNTITKG